MGFQQSSLKPKCRSLQVMKRKGFCILIVLAFLVWPTSGVCHRTDCAKRYVSGEVLVQFHPGVSQRLVQVIHGFVGATSIKRFKHVDIDRVRVPNGWTVAETVELYSLDPDVEYAEPNYYRHATATPGDAHFGVQWALNNIGQAGGTQDADIDAPEAWDKQTGNSALVVAVLDTGVDLDHEDIAGNIWRNNGEDWDNGSPGNNGVDDDGNGKIDDYFGWDFANDDNAPDDDSDGHGTHVAGIIAADGNNGVGIAGVAWSASIMTLKMLSADKGGLVSDEIEAIDYAIANGAGIINASFGGDSFSQSEYNAIKRAQEKGLLFVAAAGNAGTDNDTDPVYPASYDLANIISVAATNRYDTLVSSSNYGRNSVDVAAPGAMIYSTSVGNSYEYRTGTSMAAPHVSGLAALIWSEDFTLTHNQVKDHILGGVDLKGSLSGFISTGGRINAYNSLVLPLPPTSLAASILSNRLVDLIWEYGSSDEIGFKVERKLGSGGAYAEIATVGAGTTSYADVDVGASGAYRYRVRAYSTNGDSNYSNETVVTISSGSIGGSGGGGCFITSAID